MVIPKTKKIFCIGVDLGKATETTGIAVVEKLPADGAPETVEYHLRFLERCPPGHYRDTAAKIAAVYCLRELSETKERTSYGTVRDIDLQVGLVINQTAVNRRVADMIVGMVGKHAWRMVRAATDTESYSDGLYRVPKDSLTGELEVLVETETLKVSDELKLSRPFVNELINFRSRKTSAAAQAVNPWREGPSEDLALAAASACWLLRQPGDSYDFL